MDLNIRRGNNEYYRLLQKFCTNEDNCLVSDICYQDSLSIVLKSNYSSKLIRNLKIFNEQTNSTYIPLYRILDPNFNYFKLHEILKIEGYNQELKDIFKYNEDGILEFENIQLIDSFSKYKTIIPGYWTNNNFERTNGIVWLDSINRNIIFDLNFNNKQLINTVYCETYFSSL